jgi:UDP-N-acetylmuramate: L-alanyl-gamma-D-glutamyl-meso-diaminopimelate ligase
MDLKNKVTGQDILDRSDQFKKIFFYRICGTGMGACACLLKEASYQVEGADVNFFPPMSTYLDQVGVKTYPLDEVSDEFLNQFDLIVVGNSVPRVSKYAEQVERCGVSFISFPELMGALVLKEKKVIGIAGTHGKTTTTFFLTQLLEKLGEDPGYFIGGIINGRPPSKVGKSDYFVIESDEYDSAYFQKISKFRLYEINHLVLTSLEFDHADIFDTIEDIKDEFRDVLKEDLDSFICDNSFTATRELIEEFKLDPYTYRLDEIDFEELSEQGTTFSIKVNGNKESFKTNVVGKQNILNLCSCIYFLVHEKFELPQIKTALENLSLVKRRQEVRGSYKGAIVIDDFAHHPRSVELTVDSIKQRFSGKEMVVVFEPVSATARSSIFQNEFTESLKTADRVILANPGIKTTAHSGKDLNFDLMAKKLNEANINSKVCLNLNELRSCIDDFINEKSVLLVLSNRTCLGLWESEFVNEIQ